MSYKGQSNEALNNSVTYGWFHMKAQRKKWQFFLDFLNKKIKSFRYFSNTNNFKNKIFVIFDHF